VLSLVCSGTVQAWWMMNAKSAANHSRHVVRRLQSSVIHTLSFSFWAPSDLHLLLNEDNDGGSAGSNRNTHFCQTDKMELPRVDSCRRWYTAFTLFADEQRQVWITQFNQKITPCLPLPRIPLLKGRLLLSYGRLKCSIVICKNKRHHQMAPSL